MIPTFNQEDFIGEAIESAMAQDYKNIEIIISDDNSQDGTREKVKKYLLDKRIKYFRNEVNLGRVMNYRKLLNEYSNGDWVVNLDGDDYFSDNEFISKAINSIKFAEKIGATIVAYLANHRSLQKIDSKLIIARLDEHSLVMSGREYFINYYNIGGFTHMACIYKRDLGIITKIYSCDLVAADFLSIMRLALNGDFILADYEVGTWRRHSKNVSQTNLKRKYRDNIYVIESLANDAKDSFEPNEMELWLNEMRKKNREGYVSDLIFNSEGHQQFRLALQNFKFRYSYFMLLYNLIKKSISSMK